MNTYHSITWQSEFYYSHNNETENDAVNAIGLYSFLQYQLAKRTFLTGRYDYGEKPYNSSIKEQAYSLTFGWCMQQNFLKMKWKEQKQLIII